MRQLGNMLSTLGGKIPLPEYQKIRQVSASTLKVFSFLAEYGYAVERIEVVDSEVLAFWINIEFHSSRAQRWLKFGYFPYDHEGNCHDSISISVVKSSCAASSKNRVFDSYYDYLDLQKYIQSKCPNISLRIFESQHYDGTFNEQVEKVLHAYAYYIREVAEGIVSGEDWESGHFASWD